MVTLRAEEFAKSRGMKIYWVVAKDVPLFHEDRSLPKEALHQKRKRWLQNHDQKTAHITGMLPLVVGMPVRLTDTIDKKRHLYRYRRGVVVDWVLHPAETSTDIENGCLLSHMPLTVYVKFPGASWVIHQDLEPGVYPITRSPGRGL